MSDLGTITFLDAVDTGYRRERLTEQYQRGWGTQWSRHAGPGRLSRWLAAATHPRTHGGVGHHAHG